MEKRRKKLKRSDKKQKNKEDDDKTTKEDGFEVVPREAVKMEDYDIDSLSETLALAKKMMRARSRNQIIEGSYNRFAFEN